MNPVALKELRQLTRSRTISVSLIAFFAIQMLVAALVVVVQTDAHGKLDSDTGELAFYWFAALLGPLLSFVIPGNLFARLVSEHGPGRAELLCATALRPSAFVDGKIRSGLVLGALFLFAALPFLLLSYLLGGVDVLFILSWTAAIAFCASLAIHISLFLASARIPAGARWALWALTAIPFVPFALLSATGYEDCEWNEWSFLIPCAACILTGNLILRALSIALLSPSGTDRARPLRLTLAALLPAWLALFTIGELFWSSAHRLTGSFSSEPFLAFILLSMGLLHVGLAFDLSTPSGPSRRILAERPASRLRRLLRFPFATGPESGLAFALPMFALGALVTAFAFDSADDDFIGWILGAQACFAYILAALLLARAALCIPALGRRFPVRFTIWLAAAFIGLCMLLPSLVALGGSIDPDESLFNLAGVDFDAVYRSSGQNSLGYNIRFHLTGSCSVLAIALLLHARPVLRALRRYLRD